MKKTIVQKGVYYDSVKLMLVTRELKSLDGVEEVAVVMGTDLNKDTLVRTGLMTPEAEAASPTDMIVAVSCNTEETANYIFEHLDEMLNANVSGENKDAYKPKSVETAVKMQPGSNILAISIPGSYAKPVAMEGLRNGLHIMLFSDNVSLEEEKALKTYAQSKDLLVMGPDCGTAIINGVPLCFANTIRKGDIGIVAASGTGAQEVMTLIHKNGGGVTQVIGTGGRDLKEEIGGITMLQGLKALGEDEATKLIVVVSKPPAKAVADKVISFIRNEIRKPVVINFLGGDYSSQSDEQIRFVSTLEEAALAALERTGVVQPGYTLAEDHTQLVRQQAEKIRSTGKYVRGLYSGGTLGYEAVLALQDRLGGVNSNLTKEKTVTDCFHMDGNACVDLGDDQYTVGRAHPMIDSTLRAEVFKAELQNPETAVILLDLVLGYGASRTPEKDFVEELAKYRSQHPDEYVAVIVSVCGSKDDPQNYEEIISKLKELDVIIMPSNLRAVHLAADIIKALAPLS